MCFTDGARFDLSGKPYQDWGYYPELLKQISSFDGEVRLDLFGNIYGRLNEKTKGECIKGALTDGWELMDRFCLPDIDFSYYESLGDLKTNTKFTVAQLPFAVFAPLRDTRLMDNALMDILTGPEYVSQFLDKVSDENVKIIRALGKAGCDSVIMYDDWGTQTGTLISPQAFKEVFVPVYRKISEALKENKMKFILHSCGYNRAFLDDLIDLGVDVFQFDQLELYGVENLANEYANKVSFLSPVDVQKVLPAGDRKYIEESALRMVEAFKKCGGGLIAMDYPNYQDIAVSEEWADWARNIIIENSTLQKELFL